jgi:hypothetical protein
MVASGVVILHFGAVFTHKFFLQLIVNDPEFSFWSLFYFVIYFIFNFGIVL